MNLDEKLLEIKKRVPFLKPNEKGFGYDYANPSRVLGVFNPLLNEYGILLEPYVVSNEVIPIEVSSINKLRKDGDPPTITKTEILHNVCMNFTFVDVESGERKTVNWVGTGNNGVEQGYGSALTYATRYFLLSYFNVPVDKEDPNYIQKLKSEKSEGKKVEEPTKKLSKANVNALVKALDSGAKKPIDVRNSLSEYKNDANRKLVEDKLNSM